MTLCNRLSFIEKLVGYSPLAIDIGSDHGKLACSLLLKNIAKKVIITDISQKSLNKAVKLINKYGLNDRAKFYCLDGFNGITEDIHTAVIAGMGGMEIIGILDKMPQNIEKIILQPMKNADKLRLYLQKRCFFIETDKKISSGGRYYDIIKVDTKKGDALSENDIIYGKSNLIERDKVFFDYLQNERKKLKRICDKTN
ncbi:MAG: class I SAM-dependent methyltransferase [Clostridia bacterium]|nr:class I SAM-dependent methyltransferase [Clostridia bacterium]